MTSLFFGLLSLAVTAGVGGVAGGGRWRWPEGGGGAGGSAIGAGGSLRIDNKVRFLEPAASADRSQKNVADDSFAPSADTSGYYNRPGQRNRVRVQSAAASTRTGAGAAAAAGGDARAGHHGRNEDAESDSQPMCKCVSTPDCNPRPESMEVCGAGRYLCCYKRSHSNSKLNKSGYMTEFFNEIDDERPMLFPNKERVSGPFPPPPNSGLHGEFGPGHAPETLVLGAFQPPRDEPFSPDFDDRNDENGPILIGPGMPSGKIGSNNARRDVLVGPQGPTGVLGPANNLRESASAQRGVLVGPGGPTGMIGPPRSRGVLVGPSGPTGIIGPGRRYNPGVLVGPGGPTGIIGPGRRYNPGMLGPRQNNPGVLVGPGGPTGIIGPGRRVLAGPGGPTGRIGPDPYQYEYPAYMNEY